MKLFLLSLLLSITLGITSSQTPLEIDRATKVTVMADGKILAVVFAPSGSTVTFFGEYIEEKLNDMDGTVRTKLSGIDGMKLLREDTEVIRVSASNATAFLQNVELE